MFGGRQGRLSGGSEVQTLLRILIVVPCLNWLSGGVDVAAQLAKELKARGHEIVLLSLTDESLKRTLPLQPAPPSMVFLNSRGFVDGIRRLRKFLRYADTFDVGHSIGESAHTQLLLASVSSSRKPTTTIASLHSWRSPVFGRLTGAKGRIMNLIVQFAYSRADGVVADSMGLADEFQAVRSMQGIPLRTIWNPVEMTPRDGSAVHETRCTKPIRILGIGALHERKDFSTLLRSIAYLQRSRECCCVILGEGPLRSTLERERSELGLDDVVTFAGYQDDIDAYLDTSDVFVLSSLSEGSPLVLVRALARGVPVVATDCPYGPREILDGGKYGELVQVNAPEEMAKAITRASRTPAPVTALVERARLFEPQLATDSYVAFFEKILATTRDQTTFFEVR